MVYIVEKEMIEIIFLRDENNLTISVVNPQNEIIFSEEIIPCRTLHMYIDINPDDHGIYEIYMENRSRSIDINYQFKIG